MRGRRAQGIRVVVVIPVIFSVWVSWRWRITRGGEGGERINQRGCIRGPGTAGRGGEEREESSSMNWCEANTNHGGSQDVEQALDDSRVLFASDTGQTFFWF